MHGSPREFWVSGEAILGAVEALEGAGFEVSAPSPELLAHGVVICAWHPQKGGYLITPLEARALARHGAEALRDGKPDGLALYDSEDWPGYWARRALEGAIARAEVEGVPGYRNVALYRAAFSAGGLLQYLQDEGLVRDRLMDLGERMGLPRPEVRATVERGLREGARRPMTPPEPPKKGKKRRVPW